MQTLDIIVTEEGISKIKVETSEPVGIDFWLDFYSEFMGTEVARFPADDPEAYENVWPNMRRHKIFNPEHIETDESENTVKYGFKPKHVETDESGNPVEYESFVCAEVSFDSIDAYVIDGSMYFHADPMNALRNVFSQAADTAESYGGQEVARLVEKGAWDRLATIGHVDEDIPLELIHTKMQMKRYKLLNDIIEKVSEGQFKLGKVSYLRKDYSAEKDSAAVSSSEAGC